MKLKHYLSCIAAVVVATAKAQFPGPYVVPNKDWVQYYSQRSATGSAPNALDANSNVYLTGYSGNTSTGNIITLKYDSTGVLQYSHSYNNGGFDYGKAIKIDAAGNAYIAGSSDGGASGMDYVVIKLSPTGSQLWVKRYDQANDIDEARDICVDNNGDVYVTGKSRSGGVYQIVTLKLDGTTGNITWTDIQAGNGLDNEASGITLDPSGTTVFITGSTTDATNGTDVITYAINTGGTLAWGPKITNGSANGNDAGSAIISLGTDVVITGVIDNTTTGNDFTTIRYDGSTGTIVWKKDYDFANTNDGATALARDSAGNVGVVGKVINGTTYEYHTLLYTSFGFQYAVNVETTGLGGTWTDPKICNDTIAHHWYVSGEALRSTKDIFVYQITPTGNTSWRQTIDGQNNDIDGATSIGVNGVGVVYVGALSKNSFANYDYTTIKLNQTPVYWPPDFYSEPVNVNHLYLKNNGQLLRTDSTLAKEVLYYTDNTNPEVFIEQNAFDFVYRKNNPDTNGVVLDTIERIQCKFLNCNSLADQHELLPRSTVYNYFLGYASSPSITDVQGNERIFVPNLYGYTDLHYFSDKNGLKYYMVLKPYSTNEIQLEVDGAQSATIDATTGNLVITGVLGTVELQRPIAYSTTTLGGIVTLTGTSSWVNVGGNKFMVLPPAHNINLPLVIMVSRAPASGVGFGPKANLDYSTYYGSSGNDVFNDIKAAANGDRVVTGYTDSKFFPNLNSMFLYKSATDAVILKYTSDDTLRVASFMGGSRDDAGNSISVNANNEVFIGGNTWSSDFPALSLTGASNQTSNGYVTIADYEDGFLAKFLPASTSTGKPTLSHNWSRYFGGPGNDEINSICVDGSGNLYFVGEARSATIAALVNPAQGSNAFTSLSASSSANNSSDAILGKFNTSLAMVYGTFVGGYNSPFNGASREIGYDIVVDNSGNAIVCGSTDVMNFPSINTTGNTNTFYDNLVGNPASPQDGFIARYSPTGTKQFASYFGGNGVDRITRLAHDIASNDIYFAGDSYDTTAFPFVYKANALNSRLKTGRTAFVAKMAGDFTKQWCSFYGRGTVTSGRTYTVGGLSVDNYGVLYLSGMTTSDTIHRPSAQPTTVVYRDSILNSTEGFVAIFNPNQSLYHAHYFGGAGDDQIRGADISQNLKLYVVGNTTSGDFPISYNLINATLIDSTFNGGNDGFISRFDLNHYQVTGLTETAFRNSELKVYPNPVNTGFNLQLDENIKTPVVLTVSNLMGQLIYQETIQTEKSSVNCESWANGVYLISVSNKQGQNTFKLIKN